MAANPRSKSSQPLSAQRVQPTVVPSAPRVVLPPVAERSQSQASGQRAITEGSLTVTTTRTGDQVEKQFDGLVSKTTLADLAARGKTNVRTVNEGQLRDLIRQAVSQLMVSRAGQPEADEQMIAQVQAELQRTMALTRRQDQERQELLNRLAAAEEGMQEARGRSAVLDAQLMQQHLANQNLEQAHAGCDAEIAELQGALAKAQQEIAELGALVGDDEPEAVTFDAMLTAAAELDRVVFNSQYSSRLPAEPSPEEVDRIGALAVTKAQERLVALGLKLAKLRERLAAQEGDELPTLEKLIAGRASDQQWILDLQQKLKERPESDAGDAWRLRALAAEAQATTSAEDLARLRTGSAAAQRAADATIAQLRERLAASQVPETAGPSFAAAGGQERVVQVVDDALVRWRNDAGWKREILASGCRTRPAGRVHPADGGDRIFTIDDGGVVSERSPSERRDLTALTSAPLAAGDGPSFALAGAAAMLVYRGTDGHAHMLQGDRLWLHVDVHQASGLGHQTTAAEPACWWWAREGTRHVAVVGDDGRILELFDLGGRWQYADLTAQSSAPAAQGGLFGYAPASVEHLLFTGRDQALHSLSYDGSADGWRHQAIGQELGVEAVVGTPVGAYREGVHVIAARTASGALLVLVEGECGWQRVQHDGPLAVGDPTCGPNHDVRYVTTDGSLVLLDGTAGWQASRI